MKENMTREQKNEYLTLKIRELVKEVLPNYREIKWEVDAPKSDWDGNG